MPVASRVLSLLTSTAVLGAIAGCPADDPELGGSTGDVPLEAVGQDVLSDLAHWCGYHEMYAHNVEAFDPPPPGFDPYAITDSCREQLDQALAGPLNLELDIPEPDVRAAVLEGIHVLLFTPLFTPEPDGAAPAVFAYLGHSAPYPSALASVVPVVPATYAFEIPPGHYNPEIAEARRSEARDAASRVRARTASRGVRSTG
jgi:hypothetical protein